MLDVLRKKTPYTIGCTGGIGSGKSTVVSFFKKYGASIIDCDQIAHQLVDHPEKTAFKELVKHFSSEILTNHESSNISSQAMVIDRSKLRKIVFNNPSERQWLESYLHPLIRETIKKELEELSSAQVPYIIVDIPLLKSRKNFPFLNRVLVIDSPETLQVERVCMRTGLSKEMAKKIITAQISREERRAMADDYILNDGSIHALEDAVCELHHQYLEMAHQK